MTEQEIRELFQKRKFRATPQRIAVYKYLFDHRTHPDVEEIYKIMKTDNPALSLTTVYNAVAALENEGLIQRVVIDTQRVHYDADPDVHGHFICTACGDILDFYIDDLKVSGLDDVEIQHKDIYYRGLCQKCKTNK